MSKLGDVLRKFFKPKPKTCNEIYGPLPAPKFEQGERRTGRTFRTILKAIYFASKGRSVQLIVPNHIVRQNYVGPQIRTILEGYGVLFSSDRGKIFYIDKGSIRIDTLTEAETFHRIPDDYVFVDQF